MKHCLVDIYQVCPDGGPWVQNGPEVCVCVWGGGGLGFGNDRNILKNLLLQNCLTQVLEIWYVALPGGPLPGLSV